MRTVILIAILCFFAVMWTAPFWLPKLRSKKDKAA